MLQYNKYFAHFNEKNTGFCLNLLRKTHFLTKWLVFLSITEKYFKTAESLVQLYMAQFDE